jgi:hypothetical protein
MKQSFIISIFLLIICILISQSVDYYLHENIIEGFNWNFWRLPTWSYSPPPPPPPTSSPFTPKFIVNYVSAILKNKYLSNSKIQQIYTTASLANNVPPVKSKQNLIDFLKLLQTNLNDPAVPPIPQLVYFAISIPRAFQLFYFPEDTIPVPYNKLHSNMVDIFPTSKEYTKIQTICILWQQSMLLLTPNGQIIDPRHDTFVSIINDYIKNINKCIDRLLVLYASSNV